MLMRIWRLIVAFFAKLVGGLESRNASDIRKVVVADQAGKVAAAEQGLGALAGGMRSQTRDVASLEGEFNTLTARKNHFLKIVRQSEPESAKAGTAKEKALGIHRELAGITEALNAARTELARLASEYEASKQLIIEARQNVRDATKKGKRQDQKLASAKRRQQLVKTSSDLRGLDGLGELATLDEAIETEIDGLDGAAFVSADMASEANAERRLDAEIAQHDTDADFEAELAAMELDTSDVLGLGQGGGERKLEPAARAKVESTS